jgi:chromosome condensin MukBEF ATPase and DNA-binding subunit MukB
MGEGTLTRKTDWQQAGEVLRQVKKHRQRQQDTDQANRSLQERLRRTNTSGECYLWIALYTPQPRRAMEYAK